MVELSLLASTATRDIFPHQHQDYLQQQLGCGGLYRTPSKDFQALLPGCLSKQDISKYGLSQLKLQKLVDPWCYKTLLSDDDKFSSTFMAIKRPFFFDIQDAHHSSARFGLGVAKKYEQYEKISQFFMSGASLFEGESLNLSLLYYVMGIHTLATDVYQCPHVADIDDFPLCVVDNCMGGLSCASMLSKHPDGRMLFTGPEAEIRYLISVVSELSSKSRSGSKRQTVVPYFRRSGRRACASARNDNTLAANAAPAKRPETVKLKPSPSKKERKKMGKGKELYARNSFHACESLLSVVLDKRGKVAIHSLKKSGPEISNLLTQFSAGLAGTGLAILFSVMWKITSGKAAFCATKQLNTAFALGLVWLSAAVNKLRDNVVSISRNTNETLRNEDEMGREMEESIHQILFRAITLMAVAILRFA